MVSMRALGVQILRDSTFEGRCRARARCCTEFAANEGLQIVSKTSYFCLLQPLCWLRIETRGTINDYCQSTRAGFHSFLPPSTSGGGRTSHERTAVELLCFLRPAPPPAAFANPSRGAIV